MLPGFRFLLAAIVLSVSIVTFGLGAAALLRASHEQFASIPARRVTPEPYFAQPAEAPAPTLAMLRVEPTPQDSAATSAPALALAEEPLPEAVPVPKVDVERLATLNVDTPPAEAPAPEVTPAAVPTTAPVAAEPPAEAKLAALDATPAPPVEATVPPAELIVPPATTDGSVPLAAVKPATKTAALGNAAAAVETAEDAKKSSAKADRAELRNKQRVERAKERRRLAARRARLAAQQTSAQPTATVQQSADPFQQPAQPAATTTRRR